MHRTRVVVGAALVAALLPGVARAAPKPVCNLLTDPAGDVMMRLPGQAPSPWIDPAIDIKSLDFVSDAQGLGMALRVGSVSATNPASTHTDLGLPFIDFHVALTIESAARELVFHVTGPADNVYGEAYAVRGNRWAFQAGRYSLDYGHKYSDEVFNGYGQIAGVADPATSEIRAWVSWADLKKWGYTRAKRDRVVKVRVRAADWWLANNGADPYDPQRMRYDGAPRDEASTRGAYVLGARSCARKP